MKHKIKILFFILIIFSPIIFPSCQLMKAMVTDMPLTTLPIETISVKYNDDVVLEGNMIWTGIKFFQKPKDSEILLSGFRGISRFWKTIFQTSYHTSAEFYYGNKKQKVKFNYTFQETDPFWEENGNNLYAYPEKGNFYTISIHRLPKKYEFEIIDPPLNRKFGSPLENTFVTKKDLPVVFTHFSINERLFSIVFTKMPNEENVSFRSLIRYEGQETLITNANGIVVVSFTNDYYKIFNQDIVTTEELIIPIGVYKGLFLMLNEF